MLLLSSAIAKVYASRYKRRTLDMRGIEILGPGVDIRGHKMALLRHRPLLGLYGLLRFNVHPWPVCSAKVVQHAGKILQGGLVIIAC